MNIFLLNKRSAYLWFIIISFLIIYLQVPLNTPYLKIPVFFTILLLPVATFIKGKSLRWTQLLMVIGLFFVLILFSFLANKTLLIENLKGVFQFTFSLMLGLIYFNHLIDFNQKEMKKLVYSILILFILLSLFEIIGITRSLSDWFRHFVGYEHMYMNDWRDLLYAGHIRPKVFSAEPSFVTIVFFVLLNCFSVIYSGRYWWGFLIIIHFFVLWVTASPIVILSFASCFFIKFKFKTKLVLILFFGLLVVLVFVILFKELLLDITSISTIANRFERGIAGGDGSVNERFVLPFLALMDVLRNSPLFGVGLTGKSVVMDYSSVYWLEDADKIIGSNAFFESLIYLGFGGFLFFIVWLIRFLRKKSNANTKAPLIFLFFLSQTGGGFVTPRFWFFFFFFTAVYSVILTNKGQISSIK